MARTLSTSCSGASSETAGSGSLNGRYGANGHTPRSGVGRSTAVGAPRTLVTFVLSVAGAALLPLVRVRHPIVTLPRDRRAPGGLLPAGLGVHGRLRRQAQPLGEERQGLAECVRPHVERVALAGHHDRA